MLAGRDRVMVSLGSGEAGHEVLVDVIANEGVHVKLAVADRFDLVAAQHGHDVVIGDVDAELVPARRRVLADSGEQPVIGRRAIRRPYTSRKSASPFPSVRGLGNKRTQVSPSPSRESRKSPGGRLSSLRANTARCVCRASRTAGSASTLGVIAMREKRACGPDLKRDPLEWLRGARDSAGDRDRSVSVEGPTVHLDRDRDRVLTVEGVAAGALVVVAVIVVLALRPAEHR